MSTTSHENEQKTNCNKNQEYIHNKDQVNNSHISQSSPASKVTLNMYDCVQFYLRIPRCKLTLDHSNDKANTCMTFEDEIPEQQEESIF